MAVGDGSQWAVMESTQGHSALWYEPDFGVLPSNSGDWKEQPSAHNQMPDTTLSMMHTESHSTLSRQFTRDSDHNTAAETVTKGQVDKGTHLAGLCARQCGEVVLQHAKVCFFATTNTRRVCNSTSGGSTLRSAPRTLWCTCVSDVCLMYACVCVCVCVWVCGCVCV